MNDVESLLLESLGSQGLDAEIKDKIHSFHGLLTREAAIRIIAVEKGILKEKEDIISFSEIQKNARDISVKGFVLRVWPIATYPSGKRSRVVELTDDERSMPLILWNMDVDLADSFLSRDELLIKNVYESGGELHLGYKGKIEFIRRSELSDILGLPNGSEIRFRAFVCAISGRSGAQFSFSVTDRKSELDCTLVEAPTRGEKLKLDDEVFVDGAYLREGKAIITNSTKLLMRRGENFLTGQILSFLCQNTIPETNGLHEPAKPREMMSIDIDGTVLVLDRADTLTLFKLVAADDIALSTLVALKKGKLLNTQITIRIEKKDGKVLFRG